MFVIKRDGTTEQVFFSKVEKRLNTMTTYPKPLKHVDVAELAQSVIAMIKPGITTTEIDELSASISASKGITNIDYLTLAARIAISNHQKNTLTSFKDKMDLLRYRKDSSGVCSLLDDKFYKFIVKNQTEIEKKIDYARDFSLSYKGFKVLESNYLFKLDSPKGPVVVERPQDMFMREAIFLHLRSKKKNLELIFETYDLLSNGYYTHATPTLFNAGTKTPSCISCFLLYTHDSIDGIYETLKRCAQISRGCGGIGLTVSPWRSKGSLIRGSNGITRGIIPFLRPFNETANAVDQGSKRKGSIVIYLDTHHPDLLDFLGMRTNGGSELNKCRELNMGLWVSDIFMKRVEQNGIWSFFDPDDCPELLRIYDTEFEELYVKYENEKRYRMQKPAREIWKHIFHSVQETGMPYILFKDQVNRMSNQKNIGLVKSSNLCAEIVEVAEYYENNPSRDEIACCTLASIALPKFVESRDGDNDELFPENPIFNYKKLAEVVSVAIRNLNNVIDNNHYPNSAAERSNVFYRPLGLGVQGLVDTFAKMRFPFESGEARDLNKRIFETIYYSAISTSTKLARETYENYKKQLQLKSPIVIHKEQYTIETLPTTIGGHYKCETTPLTQGIFNFEMYGLNTQDLLQGYDWESLREHIKIFGTRNSLHIAAMPTASTSHILGNSEGIEPLPSNIFTCEISSGNFLYVNQYLMTDLQEMNVWTPELLNVLKLTDGSIAQTNLPETLKNLYKTAFEIKQSVVVDLAVDRQPFIDQSQSMNLFTDKLTLDKYTSIIFRGWKKGLKTGCYYFRTKPATTADKFTLDLSMLNDKLFIRGDTKQQTIPSCSVCEG